MPTAGTQDAYGQSQCCSNRWQKRAAAGTQEGQRQLQHQTGNCCTAAQPPESHVNHHQISTSDRTQVAAHLSLWRRIHNAVAAWSAAVGSRSLSAPGQPRGRSSMAAISLPFPASRRDQRVAWLTSDAMQVQSRADAQLPPHGAISAGGPPQQCRCRCRPDGCSCHLRQQSALPH